MGNREKKVGKGLGKEKNYWKMVEKEGKGLGKGGVRAGKGMGKGEKDWKTVGKQ